MTKTTVNPGCKITGCCKTGGKALSKSALRNRVTNLGQTAVSQKWGSLDHFLMQVSAEGNGLEF